MTTQVPADGHAATQQDESAAAAESSGRRGPDGPARLMGWLLLVGGLVGLIGAAVLSVERVLLLENPDYTPSCSLNPVVSCGQVMESWQGEVFGFPNPFLGVGTFPVVMTIGVMLLAGARLPRWMWVAFWGGTAFGAAFVTWLFVQSVYLISALCPYCMVVWVAMIPIFVYTTSHVLSEGHVPVPAGLSRTIRENRGLITAVWLLALAILITVEFWDSWYLVF